jgi:multiple sugar transport system substrate-binding protein
MGGLNAMTHISTHVAEELEEVTRRRFLQTSMGGMAGLAGVLAMQIPPSYAQAREVSMLSWAHFVPQADQALHDIGIRFEKSTKIKVRFDHLQETQMAAKLAAEVQTGTGHDLLMLRMHIPLLHATNLVDMSDVVDTLTKQYGPMYDFCKEAAYYKDHWVAMPAYCGAFPGNYNKAYFDEVGEKASDTWEDLLRAGKKMKAKGHPIGIPISQTNDAVSTLGPIMWAYGAKAVDAEGKTVTVNSPETAEAIEYVKRVFNEAMEPEVLSWDDASNNRFLISGKGSWILNPQSAYLTAKTRNMPIAEQLEFQIVPAGPKGRHTTTFVRSLGIWKFSKNIEPAKQFIKFFFDQENYNEYVNAAQAFDAPVFKSLEDHPIWAIDPKYKPIKESSQYGHLYGWPAPGDERSQQVNNSYIIPIMFAKAVGGSTTKEAMEWAETEIKRIYST